MNESLIGQAVNITLIGMSVVFVFLIILVLLMKGLGVAVRALPLPDGARLPGVRTIMKKTGAVRRRFYAIQQLYRKFYSCLFLI